MNDAAFELKTEWECTGSFKKKNAEYVLMEFVPILKLRWEKKGPH